MSAVGSASRSGASEIRADLLWIAAAAALLYLPYLGAHDLWNPNEPIYGEAVVEMARRGDWLVPTVNGEAFAEKPILPFWLGLLAARALGGVSELSLRLPSALAGIAAALLVVLLVLPYAGRRRARLAGGLLVTTHVVFGSARTVQPDLLLAVSVLAAIVAASRVIDHGLPALRGYTLAGLAVGAGLLSKGPVALVLVGLPLLVHAALARRLGSLVRPALGAGLAAAAAVAAPWFLALALRAPALFHELVWRQNFGRFTDPWDHQAPWWYYLGYLWVDMAPWALFLPLAIRLPHREPNEARLDRLAWIWIAVTVAFFSLSASKRSVYLLPCAPAVAVLVSGVAERWLAGNLGRARRRVGLAVTAACGLGAACAGAYALVRVLPRYPLPGPGGKGAALLLLAGGLAVAGATLFGSRRSRAAPVGLLALVVALEAWAAAALLPALDVYKSPRPFAEAVRREVSPADPLRSYRPWKWRSGWVFYLGREVPRITSRAALHEYWSQPGPAFVIVERGTLDDARAVLGPARPLVALPIGSNFAYLFSNRPSASVTPVSGH